MNHYTFFVTLCLITASSSIHGDVVGTPASTTILGVERVINRYLSEGGTIDDLTIEVILQRVDEEAANATAQGRLADRIQIFGNSGPIDESKSAKLIALTANQIMEDRREEIGRYAIWLTNDGIVSGWVYEDEVKTLLESSGQTLMNKGVWTQPDTKAQSMFHVGVGPKPPPDDNRVLEDQAGRRLPNSNAKKQNDQQQSTAQQPGTISEPRTMPDAKSSSTPQEPGVKPATTNKEPGSTPWTMIVVLIVAATGLLWLLLKNRK